MELEHFGVLHRCLPMCNERNAEGGPDPAADSKSRRILVHSISEPLLNSVYKNYTIKAPHVFVDYICVTANTGSHGKFCGAQQNLTSFKSTGSSDTSLQALEVICQHLVDVGENIPDRYLKCALLYILDNNYKSLRADIFNHNLDVLTIGEVYKKVLKFAGKTQLDSSTPASGLMVIKPPAERMSNPQTRMPVMVTRILPLNDANVPTVLSVARQNTASSGALIQPAVVAVQLTIREMNILSTVLHYHAPNATKGATMIQHACLSEATGFLEATSAPGTI
ncbi:hypothetical protein SARC_06956 [Sphaeroforma arctica JP610]|uniref:Uncharacterized protein n=1 Tax=Sphaeroforma arctica JP610 TaxID=667725 RepID=A0A0L0FV51_9EUKA|nr:hypothetical protein SARC_06956 [Sphaeroforma arctica JP610]KNC80707.1 hypothetical protein SARC_06956 [Sphaeroforma arctica JP610]|eukprot:XP_014154609.1 hypothetical protein SARC_06956 [Sphaeroforma arctica JP610]